MPPSPENLQGADLLCHRCMYGSKLMSSEEIDNILRIQYKSLNSGIPYNEDYYFLVGTTLIIFNLYYNALVLICQRRCQPLQIKIDAYITNIRPPVCCLGSAAHHIAWHTP